MAFEHLRGSLTRGNLWLYLLRALEAGPATPVELKSIVEQRHGFTPATITFYSVIYKLRREGLVRRSTEEFRSAYEITDKGRAELARARELLEKASRDLRPT